ncbi:hypothetical protein HYC85_021101 [Camellia sinensis]|uniref:Uncharacterized protein n=1 Tax=Camellia sinensis TaxID=4442 RepID=A0A7J7GKF5_CAMSI|nr:hypothetical protein HYC85_021101 [Camellia sinensis]
MASREPGHLAYSGRLIGGCRSVAVWIREENGKSSFQMVAMMGGRREQIFVQESKFGGGWEGFALVLERFAFGDGGASRKKSQPMVKAVGRLPLAIAAVHRDRDAGMWCSRR